MYVLQLFFYNLESATFQTHFGFTNLGSKIHGFWKFIQLFVYLFTSTKMCQPAMVTYLQGSFLKFSLDSPWENNFEAYRTKASPQSCIQYFRQMVIIGRFPSLIRDLRLISPWNEKKYYVKLSTVMKGI